MTQRFLANIAFYEYFLHRNRNRADKAKINASINAAKLPIALSIIAVANTNTAVNIYNGGDSSKIVAPNNPGNGRM